MVLFFNEIKSWYRRKIKYVYNCLIYWGGDRLRIKVDPIQFLMVQLGNSLLMIMQNLVYHKNIVFVSIFCGIRPFLSLLTQLHYCYEKFV